DLDRAGQGAIPLPLCDHQQGRRPGSAIHDGNSRLEERRWRCGVRLHLQAAGGRQEVGCERSQSPQGNERPARNIQDWRSRMTATGRLKIVLLAGLVSVVDPQTVIESASTDAFGAITSAEAR